MVLYRRTLIAKVHPLLALPRAGLFSFSYTRSQVGRFDRALYYGNRWRQTGTMYTHKPTVPKQTIASNGVFCLVNNAVVSRFKAVPVFAYRNNRT